MITEFLIGSKSKVIILFLLLFVGVVTIDEYQPKNQEPKADTLKELRQFNIDSFKLEMNRTMKAASVSVRELKKLKERP